MPSPNCPALVLVSVPVSIPARIIIACCIFACFVVSAPLVAEPPGAEGAPAAPALAWPGESIDTWHGFKRHNFKVDGLDAWVVEPKRPLSGHPWSWCLEFPDAFADRCAAPALLDRGFHHAHIAVGNTFGCPTAVRHLGAFYRAVREKGLAEKAVLIGLSRGGLYAYRWAAENPDKVAVIYGDAPVCDTKSWPGGKGVGKGSAGDWAELMRCYGFKDEAEALAYPGNPVDALKPLAEAGVAIIHVVGDSDDVVPVAENTAIVESRYRALGGDIRIIHKPGIGHHPHGLDDPAPVVSFILERVRAVGERLRLEDVGIALDPDAPSQVQSAVRDLAEYLRECTNSAVPISGSAQAGPGPRIAIGPKAARRVLGDGLLLDDLGDEGHLLKVMRRDGVDWIVATGATPLGTHAAALALMKAIEREGPRTLLPVPLDVRHVPAFAKRGMHLNGWAFRHPITFRSWRLDDWKKFLDTLAYQGVNLFYLWPFMEIIPLPLSPEDRAYLEECRQVVDYAHEAHGMEVWIMQCTNRVARDRCGVDDPRRRPYWRPSQEDLDPGKPGDLEAILASREALYRAIDNVDGVCNIDSDPGYLPGSPLSDYLRVLRGCRELLDRHNVHGKQAKLVNWMWCGWGVASGKAFDPGHQAQTLKLLREGLSEPWELVSGTFDFLSVVREAGMLAKTIVLPYSLIEDEPSYPATNLSLDSIRTELEKHVIPGSGILGAMGNVQTPILQLPHVYGFTSWIEDLESRKKSQREMLLELSRHLYPDRAILLADAYEALVESDPSRIAALADRLDGLLEKDALGRAGIIGRKLFPDHRILARLLVLQLRLRAAQERLAQGGASPLAPSDGVALLRDYLDAYLSWDTTHGWHELWGWGAWTLGEFASDPRFLLAAGRLRKCWGDEAAVLERLSEIAADLSKRHDPRAVEEGGIAPFRRAIREAAPVSSLAQTAVATASVVVDPVRYPPSAAVDGTLATLYWPGALVADNAEWLQLNWESPQTFETVVVHFLQHPSMHGRTIHLQGEVRPDVWEDFAKAVVPADPNAPHAVATFRLSVPRTLAKIRVVNLLDLFEIEVR